MPKLVPIFFLDRLFQGAREAGDDCEITTLARLKINRCEWEYQASASNPFCANGPLFVVNKLNLAGLLAVAILGARLALTEGL